MSRRRWILALTALALLTAPAAAAAHPSLLQSAPAAGVVADQAPRSIVLSFTEPVEPEGSAVRLVGPRGRRLRVGAPTARGPAVLVAPVAGALATGVYEVRWVALGPDGHTVSGRFRFGVPGRGGAPPPDADRLDAPGLAGTQAAPRDPPGEVIARWLGIVAAGVLLAGALLRWRLGPAALEPRWRRLRLAALAAAIAAAAYAVVSAAGAGEGGVRQALLGEPSGQLALVRLTVLAVVALVLAALRLPRADGLLGAAGAGALYTQALDGHLQTVEDGVPLAYAAQVAHVLAAGVWVGGLVVLVAGAARGRRALRAFAGIAAASVLVLGGTGVVAALREVDAWYFLRWTGYGQVVLVKSALLVVLTAAAGVTVLALRRERSARVPLAAEAAGALAIVLLASVLAGLVPGRGQALPAQRGNLLAGAGFGTVSIGERSAHLTLAPAEPGANVLALTATDRRGDPGAPGLRTVRATLTCPCSPRPVRVALRAGGDGTWSAPVRLPDRGSWRIAATVDGRPAIGPAVVAVGDPPVNGAPAHRVLVTADLSGRSALRCRAHVQGALLGVARLNAGGGTPDGRKVVLQVHDDGGDGARAAALARDSRARGAIALLAPCGGGAAGALGGSGDLPTIVADPLAPTAGGRRAWRTAADPHAEGLAVGRYLADQPAAHGADPPPSVTVIGVPGDDPAHAAAQQRVAGLREALRPAGVRVRVVPAAVLDRPATLRRVLDADEHRAAFVDGDPARIGRALRRHGDRGDAALVDTSRIIAANPLADERFQRAAGALGATGAISSPSEVLPDSADARRYAAGVRAFFRGDQPSLQGLRGYVAALALREGLRDGPGAASIAARLRRPPPFTDALVAPWRRDAPRAGAPLFVFLAPRFLTANLLPAGQGGQQHEGTFFTGGAWVRTSTRPYGPAGLGG